LRWGGEGEWRGKEGREREGEKGIGRERNGERGEVGIGLAPCKTSCGRLCDKRLCDDDEYA